MPTRARLCGLPTDGRVIGTVGRLEPQKNFPLLIDVFARIAKDQPDTTLVIAGDGSARAALERQVQATGLGPRLRLLGHQDDIARVHHALDLFVQSSDYEGTPNAVLEAMAFENPIVATAAEAPRRLLATARRRGSCRAATELRLESAIREALATQRGARAGRAAPAPASRASCRSSRGWRVSRASTRNCVARYPAVTSGRRVPACGDAAVKALVLRVVATHLGAAQVRRRGCRWRKLSGRTAR